MEISQLQIKATYDVAKRVYIGELEKEPGAKELSEQHGMNLGSARDYIKNFRHLMEGLVFHRTMNAFSTDYYLTQIYSDYGVDSLTQAMAAIQKHIDYYEKLRPVKLHKLREVMGRHSALLTEPIDLVSYQKTFHNLLRSHFKTLLRAERNDSRPQRNNQQKQPRCL